MGLLDWLRGKPLTPQQYLAAAQRRNPPILPPDLQQDLGQRIYLLLEQRLPADIRSLFTAGTVAIGELGIHTPNARVEFISADGCVIEIYTGLSRFLYSVSRALHTQSRVFTGPGGHDVQEPTEPVEKTVSIIEKVYRNFIESRQIARPSDYAISSEQKELASALSTHAETFAVAHEIGHIVLKRKQGGVPEALPHQEEFDADCLALPIILGILGEQDAMKNQSVRMAYAGAEFFLRVYAGLEHLGFKFEESHPLPGKRLANLRSMALELAGSRRGFMKISTIAFSYDQLLEEVERRLAGPKAERFVVGLTPERVLSALSVLVEESAKGTVGKDFVVKEAARYFAAVPENIVQQAARQAALMYFVDPLINLTKKEIEFAQHEREKFSEIIQLLPQPWCQIFSDDVSKQTKVT